MIKEQTLSWTMTQAAGRLRTYRWLFGTTIVVNLLIGLWCLLAPASFARVLQQSGPFQDAWPRIFSATWIGLNLVYLPGLRNPLFYRSPNWSSIAINCLMTVVLMASGQAFRPLAIWPFGVAIVLLIAYYRLILADVQARP